MWSCPFGHLQRGAEAIEWRISKVGSFCPRPETRGLGEVAAEKCGRAQGSTELASDTQPENDVSAAAHHALGFVDVGMVRCFRKEL